MLLTQHIEWINSHGQLFWIEGTAGLCQPIIALMPPHDTYIETHLGGGAIMKRLAPQGN